MSGARISVPDTREHGSDPFPRDLALFDECNLPGLKGAAGVDPGNRTVSGCWDSAFSGESVSGRRNRGGFTGASLAQASRICDWFPGPDLMGSELRALDPSEEGGMMLPTVERSEVMKPLPSSGVSVTGSGVSFVVDGGNGSRLGSDKVSDAVCRCQVLSLMAAETDLVRDFPAALKRVPLFSGSGVEPLFLILGFIYLDPDIAKPCVAKAFTTDAIVAVDAEAVDASVTGKSRSTGCGCSSTIWQNAQILVYGSREIGPYGAESRNPYPVGGLMVGVNGGLSWTNATVSIAGAHSESTLAEVNTGQRLRLGLKPVFQIQKEWVLASMVVELWATSSATRPRRR